ncbi:MAG: hypothetical protein HGA49_09235 [Eubacteriaceae bacterium]|nr:hypothetical protein [Eubacteriaceae bacterium]
MDNELFISVQKKVVPEIMELMELRYNILSLLKASQPSGRRYISTELNVSERHIRNEIEFFQKQGFVDVERQGILLTQQGEEILNSLSEIIASYKNFEKLSEELAGLLKIKKVIIVPGNSEKNSLTLDLMGQKTAGYIIKILKADSVIGVTGGSGAAAVARNMPELNYPRVTVLPARGGIGKSHSSQANSIVSLMASKLNAQKEMLHIPDNIDKELLDALMEYQDIKNVFEKFNLINIMIFGIGRADTMAELRNLPKDRLVELKARKGVAESFGYYFDNDGKVIFPSSTVGISIDDYMKINDIIAIAGGEEKAQAIIATCKVRSDLVLITDESAANQISNILKEEF